MKLFVGCLLLVLSSCSFNNTFDPEGYRCDPGDVCPSPYSCVEGVCRRDVVNRCQGVLCNTPPVAACADANTVRSFASNGTCNQISGQCDYSFSTVNCPSGCSAGACINSCQGVVCATPPAAECVGSVRRTYSVTGFCSNGACSYAHVDIVCTMGCSAGKCLNVDPCAGVTCTALPPSICMGTTVVRSFPNAGTCDPNGMCQFVPLDTACSGVCQNGMCLTPSLMFSQVGPQLNFAVTSLDVALGSNGSNVLAVGKMGKFSRWNGTNWAALNSPTNNNLNRVAFISQNVALAVGEQKTVLRYINGSLNSVSLAGGSGNANLIGVSGRGESNYLIADATGTIWRNPAVGAATVNTMASADGPYAMKSVYLDESDRERVVGKCGTGAAARSCIAYHFPTLNYLVHKGTSSLGFEAVGGSFADPIMAVSEAMVGQPDNDLLEHANNNSFTSLAITNQLSGEGIVGITNEQTITSVRAVYALTKGNVVSGLAGQLYRMTRPSVGGAISVNSLLYVFRPGVLSANDANGVLVAEPRSTDVNTIFRRSDTVSEALDIGEDLMGASVDAMGNLTVVSSFADLFSKAPAATTWAFKRTSLNIPVSDFDSRNGTGTLMVGKQGGSPAHVYRILPTGYTQITSRANVTLNGVCRASDTEAWAVGSAGTMIKVASQPINSSNVPIPVNSDLLDVDCTAGRAVACGANGVVLGYNGTAWTSLPSPQNIKLTHCKLLPNNALIAAGDNVFFLYDGAVWKTLPGRQNLMAIVAKSATEIYAAASAGSMTEISRFDGSVWASLVKFPGIIRGGVQTSSKVVFAGDSGLLVEGR
jgi:hypothetical protein